MICNILTWNIICYIYTKMRKLFYGCIFFNLFYLLLFLSFFCVHCLSINSKFFGTWKLFPRKIAKKIKRYCKCYINVRNLIYSRTISILTKNIASKTTDSWALKHETTLHKISYLQIAHENNLNMWIIFNEFWDNVLVSYINVC